ncbi:MAG: radical SAM protein [Bacteroidales bacterium]|nr:radical SAM protein [Bacteroidales bacterium]
MTILFNDIVFGPVKSRRFGVSLGVNLLPADYKYCTFDCIYCECGWSKQQEKKSKLPSRQSVYDALETRLIHMIKKGEKPDNLTFAGNGEPTIHPEFAGIIDDTIKLRNKYVRSAEVTVLSNSSLLHKSTVFDALNKVDNNVLKLDSAVEKTFRLINRPPAGLSLQSIIENISRFNGNQVIQTLFMRGEVNGGFIDNTTHAEVEEWINVLIEIQPKYVMIYPIERDTAARGIEKIPLEELALIAKKVNNKGIQTKVYG